MEFVSLPILDQLNPKSLLTQTLQTIEEVGEAASNINLLTGLSNKRKAVPEDIVERTGEEIFDAMQSLVGCLVVLQRDHGFNIYEGWGRHVQKMLERGYLSDEQN